jgi:hypothetical protein
MEERVNLFVAWLRDQLEYVNEKIERGKGTWPEDDYVKDEDWARLMASKDLLDSIFYVLKKQSLAS